MQAKAERLAAMLPLFPRGKSKIDGRGFYLIPGSKPTTAHYANHIGCTCEGHRRRGTCTHRLACLLVVQRAEAAAPFGPCTAHGCTLAATGKARRCDEHFRQLVERLGI
jgi:hypothetical protein